CGNRPYDWNTVLMSRLNAGTSVMSRPASFTTPSDGSSNPPMMRSVVVLPQPDGPSMLKNSPRRLSRWRCSTATTAPTTFVTFSSSTTAPVLAPSDTNSSTVSDEGVRPTDHAVRPGA